MNKQITERIHGFIVGYFIVRILFDHFHHLRCGHVCIAHSVLLMALAANSMNARFVTLSSLTGITGRLCIARLHGYPDRSGICHEEWNIILLCKFLTTIPF